MIVIQFAFTCYLIYLSVFIILRYFRNVNIIMRIFRKRWWNMSTFYERILEETSRLGISGSEFGEMLGLKKSPLTDWKNQKSKPTLDQLVRMCEIFATSSDYLLFGHSSDIPADQHELIETYNQLDRRGQHRIHTVIYEELDRMEIQKEKEEHVEEKRA